MVSPSTVNSLALNISHMLISEWFHCTLPSITACSDDSFSSLTRFPPISSVLCLFPGSSLLVNPSETASICGM